MELETVVSLECLAPAALVLSLLDATACQGLYLKQFCYIADIKGRVLKNFSSSFCCETWELFERMA